MKTEDITTFKPEIMDYLKRKRGQVVTPKAMSNVLKIGESSVMHIMLNMEADGSIRKSKTSKNSLGFFIPTDDQISNELAASKREHKVNPLRVNHRKLELLNAIRADRIKYPSIG